MDAPVRPHLKSCIQLWSPQHKKLNLMERVERRPQKWPEGWNASAERLGIVQLAEAKASTGTLLMAFQYLKGAY